MSSNLSVAAGTSHGPLLNTPPSEWGQRAGADRVNPSLIYRGREYTYRELAALRHGAFADDCAPDVWNRRHAACRVAIDAVGDVLRDSRLDALVIVSSDHKEVFDDTLLPQFAVYWGDSVRHEPFTREELDALPPGLAIAEAANVPTVSAIRKCHPELALHLIEATSVDGFGTAASHQLPSGKYGHGGIPHGWGFVFQQVLRGEVDVPVVPVFVNTFWEPNPPSARRCVEFGTSLGRAIADFPGGHRVGVVASGGLSHMVVDEEFDRAVLDAFLSGDLDALAELPADVLRSGTSETLNWIVTAAAAMQAGLRAELVDYQPCYRTEAGTGCAMAFVTWTGNE